MAWSILDIFKRSDKTVTVTNTKKGNSTSWWGGIFGVNPDRDIQTDQALGLSAVWRAIHILAESIASLPVGVYEKQANGDIVLQEDDPIHNLISRMPSPFHTSYNWRETGMVHLCSDGNHYARMKLNGRGRPVELEIIDPKKVEEIFLMEGVYYYKITGYDKVLPHDEIIHVAGLGYNGFVGKSPIESHRETLQTDQASRDYAKNFYQNGTHISGYLKTDGTLSEDALKRLSKSWQTVYSGPQNVGKVAVLEYGTDFVPITLNPQDAAWLETRKNVVEDVSRIYGVPLHMLQSLERATFNNIEHLSIEFMKHTLTPWVRRWESELNRKLFPNNPRKFIRFDMSGLLRGDLETMGEYYTKLFNIGVLNRNEIRAYLNLNAVPDGNRYFVQGNNMIPVDKIDELLADRNNTNNSIAGDEQMSDVEAIKEEGDG